MLFINNKYTKWYNRIIESAKSRALPQEIYTENHHIIPKSLGGSDQNNLVKLTAREHYICHRLLIKMTIGDNKKRMYHAFSMMLANNPNQQRDYKVTSRVYEDLKINLSRIIKEQWTDEARQERSRKYSGSGNPFYGCRHSEETLNKMRKPATEEQRKNMSDSRKEYLKHNDSPWLGRKHREESKKKISEARKGTKASAQTRQSMRNAAKNRPRMTCEHCNRSITNQNYAQWHGEKCKYKERKTQ